jgi:hypothetical protein
LKLTEEREGSSGKEKSPADSKRENEASLSEDELADLLRKKLKEIR